MILKANNRRKTQNKTANGAQLKCGRKTKYNSHTSVFDSFVFRSGGLLIDANSLLSIGSITDFAKWAQSTGIFFGHNFKPDELKQVYNSPINQMRRTAGFTSGKETKAKLSAAAKKNGTRKTIERINNSSVH